MGQKANQEILEKRKNEIIGILVITFGLFSGIAIFASTAGIVGNTLSDIFNTILGTGSFLVPLLFLIWGYYLIKAKKIKINYRLIGFFITYVFSLAFLNDYSIFQAGEQPLQDGALISGGVIGYWISLLMRTLFGRPGNYIVLSAILLIGILLWFDIFLHHAFSFLIALPTKGYAIVKKKATSFYKRVLEFKKIFKKKKQKKQSELTAANQMNNEKEEKQTDYYDDNMPEPETKKQDKNQEQKKQPDTDKTDESSDLASELLKELEGNNKKNEYVIPPLDLLRSAGKSRVKLDNNSSLLEDTLNSFGVKAKVSAVSHGPTITRYEVQPQSGVKVSKIVSLADDIALALAASDVRIEAPIPGKGAVGIEVPHKGDVFVRLRDILAANEFKNSGSKLTLALGKGVEGKAMVADLGQMPHLLIAGATGSGKSVCLNSFIISLLYKATPDQVKLILIDPKKVELNNYKGLPHLFTPVVTDVKKAANVLKLVVDEMESRYELFSESGTRGIKSYNKKMKTEEEKLPFIVVIIDELSDLMMAAAGDVEDSICRLAQMSRAAGVHLMIATQRPSVDVITGLIKANIPSRVSFAVSSQTDSRTILDMGGAEKLLGNGDMLYAPVNLQKPLRLQGAYISNQEINNVVHFVKNQTEADYEVELEELKNVEIDTENEKDELYEEAVKLVVNYRASISMLQRKLHVGHSRAARMIDTMEKEGIVGPYAGSKPREVYLTEEDLPEFLGEIEESEAEEETAENTDEIAEDDLEVEESQQQIN